MANVESEYDPRTKKMRLKVLNRPSANIVEAERRINEDE